MSVFECKAMEVVETELHGTQRRSLMTVILAEFSPGDYDLEHWISIGVILETVVERNACV
jgi:hypothetical protein